jgi:hypothetical protein
MPLNIIPNTITLDKVRIEQFTVSPQLNAVMIQYSKGYDDANGHYVPKEYAYANFSDVTFDQSLYEQVKSALYDMLNSHINPA